MAHNKINDLRDHLFEMIERIKDAKTTEDIKREIQKAEAISEIAEVIVSSAKVEVDYINAAGLIKSDSELFKPLHEHKQLAA